MDISEMKLQLHIEVDNADEPLTNLLLQAIQVYHSEKTVFSAEEIRFFENREEEFIKGGKKGYSIEESMSILRKKHNEL